MKLKQAFVIAALLSLPVLGPVQAAERIGRVDLVEVWATGTPEGGRTAAKFVGNPVEARETVATTEGGALHLTLADRTELRVGSNATLRLDEYVYDPKAGTGKATLAVSRGIARFVTGRMRKEQFAVRTPSVEIGVRGTDFSVWVEADGRTTIWVTEGAITVRPLSGGVIADVGADETVAVAAGGTVVQRNAARPLTDPGLLDAIQIQRLR